MATIKRSQAHGPLSVDYRAVGEVHPSPSNTRVHSPAQIDEIRRSIEAVGWTKPIIVDEKGEILAGHGAYQAALQMGLPQVPTIQRAGLSAAQKKAYRIADNKIAEKSTWDDHLLASEFAELQRMGFDMSLTGFNPTEIEFMLAPPPAELPGAPEPVIERRAVSKLGDLWIMGEHRLICQDSTQPATYKALLEGRQVQCVFTDPPYGVSYQGLGLDSAKVPVIEGDDLRRGQLKAMLKGAFSAVLAHTRQDAGWYVWHASKTRDDFASAMRDIGLVELSQIIWEKPGATMGWSDYRQAHEPCFYAARQGVKPAFYGDRTNTTMWRIQAAKGATSPTSIGTGVLVSVAGGPEIFITGKAPKGKKVRHVHIDADKPALLTSGSAADDLWSVGRDIGHGSDAAIHPTQKPVELARRAIGNSTREGDIVLDMFSGSSGVIIAAEQTKRHGYAIELDPHYVDAGIRRWQTMTGKQAIHAQSQKTFEAVSKARGKA